MAFEARRELQIQGAWLLRLQRSKVAVCNEAEMGTEPDRHRVQIELVRSVVDTEDKGARLPEKDVRKRGEILLLARELVVRRDRGTQGRRGFFAGLVDLGGKLGRCGVRGVSGRDVHEGQLSGQGEIGPEAPDLVVLHGNQKGRVVGRIRYRWLDHPCEPVVEDRQGRRRIRREAQAGAAPD